MVLVIAAAPLLGLVAACGVVLAASSGAFLASNWALLSDSMEQEKGGQSFGMANLATAGAGALAGAVGPLIDLLNARVPDLTYVIAFGLAGAITLSAVLALSSVEPKALTTFESKSRKGLHEH